MVEQTELELQREGVRREILLMKENIPSARIFNRLGKIFPKNSIAYWLSNIILMNIILVTPGILLGWIFGDLDELLLFRVEGIMATEFMILGMIAGHFLICAIFDDVAFRIVKNINDVENLSAMLDWFKKTWSLKSLSVFVLPFWFLWAALSAGSVSISIDRFVGFGFTLWVVLVGLLAGLLFFVPFWSSLLAFHLRNFKYEMNTFSPSDSEVINDISEIQTRNVYVMAVTAAIITLFSTSKLVNQQLRATFSLPFLGIAWILIVSLFLLTRSTLKTIVNRAKWETLLRLQVKINFIQATGDLSDKDTAERLLRLADIHKQIMASKSSTFDVKSVLTLFSQLMLPLLGLILGNFEEVQTLLGNWLRGSS